MEFQIVFLDRSLNLMDRGLVYANEETARKEMVKINNMFRKQCVSFVSAYIQEFKEFSEVTNA